MEVLFSMEFLGNALKRAQYKAVKTVYAYFKTQNEKAKQKETYKKALELAKERGLNTALYDDCLKNWAEVEEDIRKIRQEIDIEKTADAETAAKLRYLISCLHWPLMLGKTLNSILYTQHWLFDRQPEDEELQPVKLEWERSRPLQEGNEKNWLWESSPLQEDYKKSWLDENLFTTSNRLVRAVVYEEDSPQDYNFQNLPFGKLVDKIQDLSIRWGEAARATGFEFDKPLNTRDIKNADDAERLFDDLDRRLEVTYNAAPEDLRDEYRKAIRRLVKEVWEHHQKKLNPPKISAKTISPRKLVCATDKVSQKVFSGELESKAKFSVATGQKGKKAISALLSIDFDDLGKDVLLEPFDRSVHDAVVSLYDAGNEYMTPQMIFKVLTGNKNSKTTENNSQEISKSVKKCIDTKIELDATAEAAAYGFDKTKATYYGQLLMADRMEAELNGEPVEAIHVYRTPILYEYAEMKNQVARIDLNLLDTPLNKTNEVLMLQDYLLRRISAMKNPNSKLEKTILYKTIFEQIKIEAETDGALRKKKTKTRNQVRDMLDYWKEKKFIKNYTEIKRGSGYYSINIFLPAKGN